MSHPRTLSKQGLRPNMPRERCFDLSVTLRTGRRTNAGVTLAAATTRNTLLGQPLKQRAMFCENRVLGRSQSFRLRHSIHCRLLERRDLANDLKAFVRRQAAQLFFDLSERHAAKLPQLFPLSNSQIIP